MCIHMYIYIYIYTHITQYWLGSALLSQVTVAAPPPGATCAALPPPVSVGLAFQRVLFVSPTRSFLLEG